MRSVINLPSRAGILAIAEQQFDLAKRIMKHGLVPIVEPEVLISSPDKAQAEAILLDTLLKELDRLEGDQRVMLKLTIPERPDHYAPVIRHDRVVRVVALSGGYTLDVACDRLAANHGMIASFSRALLDVLKVSMNDAEFDAALAATVEKIYRASTVKR
jgi:fructose-bisphosphate aldolase class I